MIVCLRINSSAPINKDVVSVFTKNDFEERLPGCIVGVAR